MHGSNDIRWEQRFENFTRALGLLRDALARGPGPLNQLEKEGVVQRFEYTLELAWKTIKDYLEASGVVLSAVTPRQVVKDVLPPGSSMTDRRGSTCSTTETCCRTPTTRRTSRRRSRRSTAATCRSSGSCTPCSVGGGPCEPSPPERP